SDVVSLLDRLEAENGKHSAESALVAFRRLANWYSLRNEDYTTPVVRGMGRVDQMASRRTRVVSDDEVRTLWAVTDTPHPYHSLVRFLLLTATRLEEACSMSRAEVQGDTWTIPAERMKGKQPHVVPLSQPALDTMKRVPIVGVCPLVFTTNGR